MLNNTKKLYVIMTDDLNLKEGLIHGLVKQAAKNGTTFSMADVEGKAKSEVIDLLNTKWIIQDKEIL